jgi:hypothetical protein
MIFTGNTSSVSISGHRSSENGHRRISEWIGTIGGGGGTSAFLSKASCIHVGFG